MESWTASKIIPLYDQQEEWRCRMRMIHEARQFIYASTYFLHYDRYGREYTEALLAARRRGVKVTVLIDGFGQKIAGNLMTKKEKKDIKQALSRLMDDGVYVRFYRCGSPLKKILGSGMHIKMQLSEMGGALFASGNISATSYDKWREFSVYVEGSIVSALLQEFSALGVSIDAAHLQRLRTADTHANNREVLHYLSYNPAKDPHPLNPVRLKYSNTITDYLASVFTNAKQYIRLTSFYFKPVPVLMNALIKAAKRGVAIEIFHSHRDALGPTIMPWIPSLYLYPALIDAGIGIYENRRGEHSKIILIDGEIAIFGSYNLEYASHDRVAEAMMVSTNQALIDVMESMFVQLRLCTDNTKVVHPLALPKALRRKVALLKPLVRWI